MTLRSLLIAGAFALALATPAHAQLALAKPSVAHLDNEPTYMGGFWPGERGGFSDRTLWHERFPFDGFQDFWIIDLFASTKALTLEINAARIATFPTYESGYLTLYADAGTECEGGGSIWCYAVYTGPMLGFNWPLRGLVPRHTSLRVENLPAGRYIFRLAGTVGSHKSGYTGTVTVE